MEIINIITDYLITSYEINPIGQIIGFIAFILWVIALLNKNDNKTKSIQWASLFLWVAHYYIFWLYTWLVSDLLWWFRNFLSMRYKKNKLVISILFVLYLTTWYVAYDNIYSVFPIISWLIATSAYFYLEWIKLRLVMLTTSFLWIVYNYFWYSLWWMIADITFMCANITTITRLYIDKKRKSILI